MVDTMEPVDGTAEASNGTVEPQSEDMTAEPTGETTAPAKRAVRKKRAGKRAAAAKKATKRRAVAPSAHQAKYPRHSVEKALRIPQAIYDQNAGKPSTLAEAARYTTGGKPNGPFSVEVSSAKKYGFLKSEGNKLVLQDRARKAIAPQSDTDRASSLQEAILAAPDISEVYNNYRGENLPDPEIFRNALIEKFGIPADKVPEFIEIFNESMVEAGLVERTGDRTRLIDVGRDPAAKPAKATGTTKVSVAEGSSCFVMQPFGGHLGGYYESIFKPAIEQAGLAPVRADADIFGTGKIMDQVWRGIRNATVLVAELTSKNPNVFYELGLAHALEKPVVLVSSNTDDVPFDLQHIRVILYDQTDPFWGQKLIDKIADNVKSAVSNPEEAIFRAETV